MHILHSLGYSLTDLILKRLLCKFRCVHLLLLSLCTVRKPIGMLVLCSAVCAIAFVPAAVRELLSDLETNLRPQQHTIDFRIRSVLLKFNSVSVQTVRRVVLIYVLDQTRSTTSNSKICCVALSTHSSPSPQRGC